jgi:hypothetical protein
MGSEVSKSRIKSTQNGRQKIVTLRMLVFVSTVNKKSKGKQINTEKNQKKEDMKKKTMQSREIGIYNNKPM